MTNLFSGRVSLSIRAPTPTGGVATIAVGGGPGSVAVNPAGTRAYVTNSGSDTVSVVDTATNTVVATPPVGDASGAVAINPAGTRVYVTGSDTLSVIDTTTNNVVATIAVGEDPTAVAFNPAGARVYVTNIISDTEPPRTPDRPLPPVTYALADVARA